MTRKICLLLLVLIPFFSFSQLDIKYLTEIVNQFNYVEQPSNQINRQFEKSSTFQFQLPQANSLIKSVQENGFQLDSINKYHFSSLTDSSLTTKELYQYDQNGFQTLDISLSRDKKWVNNWKLESAYDENGYQTLYALYFWDYVANQWYGDNKNEYTYNTKGQIIGFSGTDEWDFSNNKWCDDSKNKSTYNETGQLLTNTWYGLDATNQQLNPYISDEYVYNENGGKRSYTNSKWDPATNHLLAASKSEFTYNGADTTIIFSNWDTTSSQWINSTKNEYLYTSSGSKTLSSSYNFDKINLNWVENTKQEYSYDDNGKNILVINFRIISTSEKWEGEWKKEYTYDTGGNNILYHYYIFDSISSQWLMQFKSEFSYDTYGNQSGTAEYSWDSTNNQWVGLMKQESTYDENGNRTLIINYYWETQSNKFRPSSKVENSYDGNGKLTLCEMFFYNGDDQWISSVKYAYGYDASGQKTMEAYYDYMISMDLWQGWKNEYYYDDEGNTTVFINYDLNKYTNQFILTNKAFYYYSSKNRNSNTQIAKINTFKMYPNPVKDYVSIEVDNKTVSQCLIFNSKGQFMLKYPILDGMNTLNVSWLSQGLYSIQIPTKNGTLIKKMAKE